MRAIHSHIKAGLWGVLVEARSGKVINPDDDDIASYILALLAGHASKAEVANLGNRSLGRKVARGGVGAYQGHLMPIGLALQLRTESELEKWTVETADDGRLVQDYPEGREHWFEPGSKPGDRKKGDLLFLVPTRRHPERLAWAKQAYEWYLVESVRIVSLMNEGTRVIHQDVELGRHRLDFLVQSSNVGLRGEVGQVVLGGVVALLSDHGRARLGLPPVPAHEDDPRPFPGQFQGGDLADPGDRPCDQDCLAAHARRRVRHAASPGRGRLPQPDLLWRESGHRVGPAHDLI